MSWVWRPCPLQVSAAKRSAHLHSWSAQVLHGCRAGAEAIATSSGGVVSLHSGSDAFDELLASRKV